MPIGLQNTKRRISSVKTTKKITKAMEMIATTKLRTWRARMLETRAYTDALVSIIQEHLSGEATQENPLFSENVESDKILCIVITSQLGLCGSYNYYVYQKVAEATKPEDDLWIIGSRGERHFANEGRLINRDYADIGSRIDYTIIKNLGADVLKAFLSKKYRKVEIIYTHFVNSLVSTPTVFTILPLPDVKKTENASGGFGPLIEPNPQEVIAQLIPFYVNNVIYSKIIESQIAEQSIRRFAMDQASDNADELIEQLLLEYNKERQANITQEISEIVGGANVN